MKDSDGKEEEPRKNSGSLKTGICGLSPACNPDMCAEKRRQNDGDCKHCWRKTEFAF